MLRFLSAAIIAVALFHAVPSLAAPKKVYTPPMNGDMAKLIQYEDQPGLPAVKLASADQGFTDLSDHKGQLIILNMWATWCPPCIRELPSLNALQKALDPNYVRVLTVSLDTKDPESIKTFLADHHLDALPGYMDVNGDVQHLEVLNGAAGIPLTLIIDPQMRVLARFDGDTDWNSADAHAMIDYYRQNVSFLPY